MFHGREPLGSKSFSLSLSQPSIVTPKTRMREGGGRENKTCPHTSCPYTRKTEVSHERERERGLLLSQEGKVGPRELIQLPQSHMVSGVGF